ncbi:hypothetical protein HUA78_19755 [Myxococcus sp. CA033]|uniref:hypothetical protein n=1 Tax=Myxococcus sp. CA033 TaxID=2741516 RepID=UPI00157AF96C|nr:hypothetical protein [Myxococcus sp. CA033]NTX36686.1 hypothetical protein [Myxococcus sp. CA033]
MNMVQCSIHGLQEIVSCCEHVAVAVAGGGYERACVVVDGWGSAVLLCGRCREVAVSNIKTVERGPNGGYDLDWGLPERGRCDACASAWYEATGQGEFWATINQARMNAGFKVRS